MPAAPEHGLAVVVFEDSPDQRRAVEVMLRLAGHRPYCADGPAGRRPLDAVTAALAAFSADVVVWDLSPVRPLECEQLAAACRTGALAGRALVITTTHGPHAERFLREANLRVGTVLVKPYGMTDLLQALDDAAGHSG